MGSFAFCSEFAADLLKAIAVAPDLTANTGLEWATGRRPQVSVPLQIANLATRIPCQNAYSAFTVPLRSLSPMVSLPTPVQYKVPDEQVG